MYSNSYSLFGCLSFYPRHTKYAMGVYTFCLFCVSVCQSASLSVIPLIQEGQLSVSDERMCTILVNRLED